MGDFRFQDLDWERLRKYRTGNVLQMMDDNGLDALVAIESMNVRYLADLRIYIAPEIFKS